MEQKKIYALELGINLSSKQETDYFKWFLACFELVKEDLVSPDAILEAGWDKLVAVLDRGHYVRYDFSTATKLLDVCQALKEKYGTLTNLLKQSQKIDELSSRLQEMKSIGPKTTEIFLRDIAPIFSEYHT